MPSCYPLPQWMRPRRCCHVQGDPPEDGDPDLRVYCCADADYRAVAKADAALIGVADAITYWCEEHAPPRTHVPMKLAVVGGVSTERPSKSRAK